MTPAAPLPHRAGEGEKSVPTRRDIERHLRTSFPDLSASAAHRSAAAALDVRRARPHVDVLRWAEEDVQRRRRLAGLPLLLRGFDPTARMALRNIAAGGGAA